MITVRIINVKTTIHCYETGEVIDAADVKAVEELKERQKRTELEGQAEREKMGDFCSKNFEITQLGVKVSHLRTWRNVVLDLKLSKLTTREICDFIKQLTVECGSSYCEMLKNRNLSYVGLANVFVSHAWDCYFIDTLEALIRTFQGKEEETVVWFDIFSHNQHSDNTNRESNWWVSNLKEAINRIHSTVTVFTSLVNPYTLTRAWCLWELYCTIITDSKFEIAWTKEAEQQFIKDCYTKSLDLNQDLVLRVNSEKASSFNSEDHDQIHRAIKYSVGGYGQLNELIDAKLRESPAFLAAKIVSELNKTGNMAEDLKNVRSEWQRTLTSFEMMSKMKFRKVGHFQDNQFCYQSFVPSNEKDAVPICGNWDTGSYEKGIQLVCELLENKQL
jgi:hypothetical protein